MHPILRQIFSMIAGGAIVAVILTASGVGAQEAPQTNDAAPLIVEPVSIENVTQTHAISYQGQLLNPASGAPVSDGTYFMQFRIYDAPTGGNILSGTAQNVTVSRGIFSTILNVDTSVFSGGERWIGVQVGTDPEAQPRQPVTYVPYAIWARNADTIDGIGSHELARTNDRRLPIAFGVVNEDGSERTGFNFDSRVAGDNIYEIEIEGVDYNLNNFITIVTPISQSSCPRPVIAETNSADDMLLVEILDEDGDNVRCKFHFVVYRP